MKQKLIQKQKERSEEKKDKLKKIQNRLQELKKEFHEQQSINLIREFEILNEYYQLVKSIAGRYSIEKLAREFEIGWGRCKRIMSLTKANKRTWKLIEQGKVEPYKVSYVLERHGKQEQDEIINDAIKYNLSARTLERIRSTNLKEYKEQLKEKILEEGYTVKSNAHRQFSQTLSRMNMFLLMDIDKFPKSKLSEMYKKIERLNKKTSDWLKIHKKIK